MFRSSIEGPFEFRQYLEQVKNYANTVNISRATVPFVVRYMKKNVFSC